MDIEQSIDRIIAKLSLAQKASLLHGCDSMCFGGIPEADIPKVKCADGPQGIRLEDGTRTTALPCGMALAATWNPESARQYGTVIAEEALANGIHVSLGPGFNLMRTPLNGRNFEYYGEDPVLAGKIATGYVKGCQDKGVAATPKHLALNNQEICRTVGSSNCDKKTLRELYLEAFEIVIREARPWMMMSSYNRINGTYASAYRYTQQEFCKDECGFDGVMVSDWGGTHAAMESLRGGLDLEMGGDVMNWMNAPLMDQLACNKITEEELDDHVRRVLRLILRVTAFSREIRGKCATAVQGRISRKTGCESAVLLKNDGMLPLDVKKLKRILVCGPSANFYHYTDLVHSGGSGAVHPRYEVTALEAIRKRLGKSCKVDYAPGVLFRDAQLLPDELVQRCTCEFFDTMEGLKQGKKPFYRETGKSLQLHWGIAFAAGLNNAGKILSGRTYAVKAKAILVSPENATWRLGVSLTRMSMGTLFINGKCVMEASECKLMDNEVKITVKAGQKIELELRAWHFSQTEDGDCKFILHADEKLLRDEALKAAEKADAVIYVGGSNHHYDREAMGWGDVKDADIPGLELPDGQSEFIAELSRANDKVIVSLMGGSVMNVESWIDSVNAVVDFWYPGQECGNVMVDVLTGKESPEGHLPFTWGKRLEDYACHANGNYPGVREGHAPHVQYDEGIFIGYRHFDRAKIVPRFPFGYGLSYTEFQYSVCDRPKVTGFLKDKSLKVIVQGTVKNIGRRAGQALVQLYVGQPQCRSEKRPLKVLRNFAKLALNPGEEQKFSLTLTWRDFAFFSEKEDKFIAEAGICRLMILDGQSRTVADIPVALKSTEENNRKYRTTNEHQ